MRSLLITLVLVASSMAQAESMVEKLYEMHFESVKETLSVLYGVDASSIQKESQFSNLDANNKLIRPDRYILGIVKVSDYVQNQNYQADWVAAALVELVEEGLCDLGKDTDKGLIVLDAECISQMLWRAKQLET